MTNEDKELTSKLIPSVEDPATGTPDSDGPNCPLCRERAYLPNAETLSAIQELREGRGTRLVGTIEELLAKLDAEDDDEGSQ